MGEAGSRPDIATSLEGLAKALVRSRKPQALTADPEIVFQEIVALEIVFCSLLLTEDLETVSHGQVQTEVLALAVFHSLLQTEDLEMAVFHSLERTADLEMAVFRSLAPMEDPAMFFSHILMLMDPARTSQHRQAPTISRDRIVKASPAPV